MVLSLAAARFAALLCLPLLLAACTHDEPARPATTATPAPTASPSTPTPVVTAPTPSTAPSASAVAIPEVTWARTHHVKRVQGECTFEFDTPEELRPTKDRGCSGPTCFTLESKSFQLVGFEGVTLYAKPDDVPMATFGHSGEVEVLRTAEGGNQLAIVMNPARPGGDPHGVFGSGGEPQRSGRDLGCRFSCSGPRDRLGDVVKICKSARITVKGTAKK
jgi:hypothetical protein